MGHCFSQELDKPRIIGNHLVQNRPTKLYSQNSALQFEIKTWYQDHLPNLRYVIDMTTKSYSYKEAGKVIFDSKTNSTAFENYQNQNPENISESHNYLLHPTTVLQLQIHKQSTGFKVEFVNEPGYELLTKQKQLRLGEKFYIYGLQYQLIDLVHNKKNIIDKSGQLQEIQSSTDFSNFFRKSFFIESDRNNKISQSQKPMCRICLGNQSQKGNPFVSPCDCIGSVKYSHLNCWKKWIMSVETKNKYFCRWSITKQQCELCKKDFLRDQKYRQKFLSLIKPNLNLPVPFVVLEAVEAQGNCLLTKKSQQKLSFIIISFGQKKKLSVGTSVGVEVPLAIELGQGRRNGFIEYKSGKVMMQDSMTKYGTYFRTENPVVIKNDVPRHFLYKNNLLTLKVQ